MSELARLQRLWTALGVLSDDGDREEGRILARAVMDAYIQCVHDGDGPAAQTVLGL